MFTGPVLTREVITSARRTPLYVLRAAYPAGLLVLLCTAWLVYTGPRLVRGAGDVAYFGAMVFELLSTVQLALAIFFSALFTAAAVAQEKDRRTLELLLMTHLTNRELVLGKLAASLLHLAVMFAAALPVFMLLPLLGGVSFDQIARVYGVTLAAMLLAGSVGSTVALWRETTFQTLATTAIVIVAWLGVWEVASRASAVAGDLADGANSVAATLAAIASPLRALAWALRPNVAGDAAFGWSGETVVLAHVLASFALALLVNAVAVWRIRAWNPTREPGLRTGLASGTPSNRRTGLASGTPPVGVMPAVSAVAPRPVWENPIAWREIRTWAYGRRVRWIRFAYAAVAVFAGYLVLGSSPIASGLSAAAILAPLFVCSLMLVNALSVTSITSERDARALDLLLVTELSPKQIVFGKLGGALYNTREMVVLPIVLCLLLGIAGKASWENVVYLLLALAVLDVFVAVLGLHCGMIYQSGRSAILASQGTLFFLFVGVATCIAVLLAFSGSSPRAFEVQLAPFLAFMVGGSAGLYFALGAKSPSAAIGWAALVCPFATFWAITSYFLGYTLGIFLVTAATYTFATLAMLVPAVAEFDAIIGRTTGGEV
jgi:ABC-type transport system involved in multi-copper enzyme maturation permease subunit